jgi:hypothetical protein
MSNNHVSKADGSGKRFNSGKLRFDLRPTYADQEYVKVLTQGAKKYGDHNWRNGMPWTTVIASLERHIHAFKCGQDTDEESGLSHMAHVMCNAAFLLEYEKIYPQGDNRIKSFLVQPNLVISCNVLIDEKSNILVDQIPLKSDILVMDKDSQAVLSTKFPEHRYLVYDGTKNIIDMVKDSIFVTRDLEIFINFHKNNIPCYLFGTGQKKSHFFIDSFERFM